MKYADKLLDYRWKQRRIEILNRDDWECKRCKESYWDTVLDVHHLSYCRNHEPWEYGDDDLITLCRQCHEAVTLCGIGYEGIRNKWSDYERVKRVIAEEMNQEEYERTILAICNSLSL